MADTKVSALTAATPLATDEVYLVDDPGGSPSSKRATVADVLDIGVADITDSSAATVPLDPTADTALVVQGGNLVRADLDDARAAPWETAYPDNGKLRVFESFTNFSTTVSAHATSLAGTSMVSALSGAATTITNPSSAEFAPVVSCNKGTDATGRAAAQIATVPMLWNSASKFRVAARIKIPTLAAAGNQHEVRVGLANSWAATPTDGGLFFRFQYGDTTWECVNMDDSTETVADSGITVVAGTWYVLDIYWNGTIASYRIDGVEVATQSANIPDFLTSLFAGFGIFGAASGPNHRSVRCNWFLLEAPLGNAGTDLLRI